ncbi:hypothetical protein BDK51DRAFT_39423 [Blyttiomyces helicus]|uniref:Uncharacterized protein n=1 Tax=Blyttiomyces helicus TaxID=388810 RepID=A0A4P9W213_9FUNG|nr:hypothetical protein BDK51DRAFT_39423 [Blyttiomyces helicus]|eukprot:RKO84116.1 hypothetical protein BDK51DRAFT_39423 [Blyttiomyces helicus]
MICSVVEWSGTALTAACTVRNEVDDKGFVLLTTSSAETDTERRARADATMKCMVEGGRQLAFYRGLLPVDNGSGIAADLLIAGLGCSDEVGRRLEPGGDTVREAPKAWTARRCASAVVCLPNPIFSSPPPIATRRSPGPHRLPSQSVSRPEGRPDTLAVPSALPPAEKRNGKPRVATGHLPPPDSRVAGSAARPQLPILNPAQSQSQSHVIARVYRRPQAPNPAEIPILPRAQSQCYPNRQTIIPRFLDSTRWQTRSPSFPRSSHFLRLIKGKIFPVDVNTRGQDKKKKYPN